jgi:hypothetical protein
VKTLIVLVLGIVKDMENVQGVKIIIENVVIKLFVGNDLVTYKNRYN